MKLIENCITQTHCQTCGFGRLCREKLHDEPEYNRSLHKHIGRNVVFEPAGNERGATEVKEYLFAVRTIAPPTYKKKKKQ